MPAIVPIVEGEGYLLYASREVDCAGILVLLDLDDGCPEREARALARSVRKLTPRTPLAVVLAHREYESWFLASLDSIKDRAGISSSRAFEGDVESICDVKGWFTRQMPPGRIYKETIHQAAYSTLIDFASAEARSRSFQRLLNAVSQIVSAARPVVTP